MCLSLRLKSQSAKKAELTFIEKLMLIAGSSHEKTYQLYLWLEKKVLGSFQVRPYSQHVG